MEQYDGGEIVWVYEKDLERRGKPTGHYYFIPPGAIPDSSALNEKENGWGQYPQYTVAEVRMRSTSKWPRH